ncbi:DDE superfamily endonuclease [Ceratobasidium sp. AG-Ba]|nr:DDE superfamily endonuclease [Ceratobasidium sp. AG-Ba]
MGWYDSKTMEYHAPALEQGERLIMVWFHDESIFYTNDRRLTRWVSPTETAVPYAKGEGASIMVADFVGIEGWLHGLNQSDHARIVLFPGKTRDGYLTGEKVRNQLTKAIEIVQAKYPHAEHVFIYDNATTHTKRREDLAVVGKIPLQPSKNFGEVVEKRMGEGGKVVNIRARYADTHHPDGSPQALYFPDDHITYPGYFKGIAQLLQERGFSVSGLRLQCAAPKKCSPGSGCCARQLLSEQPGFAEQQSALEEIAESKGCRILFLPKFHCELNPIEQCWGYAKRVYRQFPRSKSQANLKSNMITSLDSVPLESIRRFFNKSQRYIDAYRHGLDGQMAAWANKKYHGHRMLPPSILREVEAEYQRQNGLHDPELPPPRRNAAVFACGSAILSLPESDKH